MKTGDAKRQCNAAERGAFSGRITQRLVREAEDLFGQTIDEKRLNEVLEHILCEGETLSDGERKQLGEISQLLAHLNQGQAMAGLACPGEFTLTLSQDRMFLTVSISPPVAGGEAVTVEQILQTLKQQNITLGVEMQAIQQSVENAAAGREVHDVVIVRGKSPRPGENAKVLRFGRRRNDQPLEPVSDRLLERGETLLCHEGDVVMQYVPPVPGEAGYTATGEAIEPEPSVDVEVTAGRHIHIRSHDFVAEVSGVVLFEGNRVEARKALVLNQDLTPKSDPIDFDGDVHIRASVRSGAKVRATGNIIIEGNVEAAEIESIEGDVVLRSGVAGRLVAVIRAGRDINARFAESAQLRAERDIVLQVGSLHSNLVAYHEVRADQGKGHIAGGTVIAGQRVRAKSLGARGGAATHVTVGLNQQVLEALSRLDQQAARARQRREGAVALTEQIRRAVGDPMKLSATELQTYAKLRQLELVCDVQIRKLQKRREQVLSEASRCNAGRVEVLLSVVSNVTITIGSGETEPDGRSGPCTFLFDEASEAIIVKNSV